MSKNIVIAIGGTGAKVVEAMLHLSATGIGPSAMDVGFIDQDKANGNVSRAIDLLKLQIAARAAWRTDGTAHRLARPETTSLFRTNIEPLHELDDNLWVPDPKGRSTLAGIFGDLGSDQMLFDLLFSHEEQRMPLDGGYRGKPHLGAAAITAHANENGKFWASLVEKIKMVGTGQEVRVLLTGSVFGGAGAAGFPTVARLIRQKLKENNIKQNVAIGGVLMLPYFTFGEPSEDDGDPMDVARAAELLTQSRGALRHYQWQLEQGHLFDELYFAGWDLPNHLDYHESEAGNQKNPALLPEMLAAAAGYRFLDGQRVVEAGADQAQYPRFISARRDRDALTWADLPPADGSASEILYARIAQFLRFSVSFIEWRQYFADQRARRSSANQPWYKSQGLDLIDWDKASPSEKVQALGDVIRRFLEWAGSIQAYASRDGFAFNLWNLNGLVTSPEFKNPSALLEAHANLAPGEYKKIFGQVATHDAGGDKPIGSAELADLLNNHVVGADHAGLGTLITSMHAFSAPGVGPWAE